MIEKLKNKKILAGILIIVILLVAIPFTIMQVQKFQENRSRASGEAVAVHLIPQHQDYNVDDSVSLKMAITGGAYDVSAIDITIIYDPDLLGHIRFAASCTVDHPDCNAIFQPTSSFTTIINDNSVPGTIHYVGVNPTATQNLTNGSAQGFVFGTLLFNAEAAGTAHVGFSNIHINAAGVAGKLDIDTANTKEGTYTISAAPSPAACSVSTDGTNDTCGSGFTCHRGNDSICSGAGAGQTITCTGTCVSTNPTVTQAPTGTNVGVYLSLIGIGINSGGQNNNPKNPTRAVSLKLYDAQNGLVETASGSATYQTSTGLFVGNIPVTAPSGTYRGVVRVDNTLYKGIPGIITIVNGQTAQTQPVQLVPGDFNGDNVINLQDYNSLISATKQ